MEESNYKMVMPDPLSMEEYVPTVLDTILEDVTAQPGGQSRRSFQDKLQCTSHATPLPSPPLFIEDSPSFFEHPFGSNQDSSSVNFDYTSEDSEENTSPFRKKRPAKCSSSDLHSRFLSDQKASTKSSTQKHAGLPQSKLGPALPASPQHSVRDSPSEDLSCEEEFDVKIPDGKISRKRKTLSRTSMSGLRAAFLSDQDTSITNTNVSEDSTIQDSMVKGPSKNQEDIEALFADFPDSIIEDGCKRLMDIDDAEYGLMAIKSSNAWVHLVHDDLPERVRKEIRCCVFRIAVMSITAQPNNALDTWLLITRNTTTTTELVYDTVSGGLWYRVRPAEPPAAKEQ